MAALTLLVSGEAVAEDSLVVGRVISQNVIENVEICDEGEICLGAWIRWKIRIERILSGPPIDGRIRAATIQTSMLTPAWAKKHRAFILRPIEDESKRKLLDAEFYLEGRAVPQQMYCFHGEPIKSKSVDVFVAQKPDQYPYCVLSDDDSQ